MTQTRTYGADDGLPKGWKLVKIIVPVKLKSGKSAKPREVYVARDEEGAERYSRARGEDPRHPDGRAVFARMEMVQILDTCRKFPRKQWRKIMLDCIKDATAFKLALAGARFASCMTSEEAAAYRKKYPEIPKKDLEPVSYKVPDTKKKKKPVVKRKGPDTDTREMFHGDRRNQAPRNHRRAAKPHRGT